MRSGGIIEPYHEAMRRARRIYFVRLLQAANGKMTLAAELAGIDRSALYKMVAKNAPDLLPPQAERSIGRLRVCRTGWARMPQASTAGRYRNEGRTRLADRRY